MTSKLISNYFMLPKRSITVKDFFKWLDLIASS